MRVFVSAVVLLLASGIAHAEPKQKVSVDTNPAGATVYLNAKEDGPVCEKTPCSFDAPVGKVTLIVELAGHRAKYEELTVPARPRAALKYNYTLEVARGSVTLNGPKGATVKVDKQDKGKVPQTFDIDAGVHEAVWYVDGKAIDTQPFNIDEGEEVELTGKVNKEVATGGGEETKDPGGEETKGPRIVKTAKPRERSGPIFAVSLAFQVGFRDFTYDEPHSNNLNGTESERGQLLAGPVVELWPGTALGVKQLSGFALLVRYGYGLNQQTVLNDQNMPTTAKTFWRSFEASARQRWKIAETATVEVGAGYVRDQHQFESQLQDDLDRVPDADYPAVKFGLRGSLLLGNLEPYASFEQRTVLPGIGQIEKRFSRGADASGFRAGLGAALHLGHIAAIVEGALTRYSWTFRPDTTDKFQTEGGTDSIKMLSFMLGYTY